MKSQQGSFGLKLELLLQEELKRLLKRLLWSAESSTGAGNPGIHMRMWLSALLVCWWADAIGSQYLKVRPEEGPWRPEGISYNKVVWVLLAPCQPWESRMTAGWRPVSCHNWIFISVGFSLFVQEMLYLFLAWGPIPICKPVIWNVDLSAKTVSAVSWSYLVL